MQPESRALLWDARRATDLIASFVNGRSLTDYVGDPMRRSAVERQFEIVGEAFNRLSRVDAATAARIPDLPRIVAFRNVLAHGYAVVDDALVWQLAKSRVTALQGILGELLEGD